MRLLGRRAAADHRFARTALRASSPARASTQRFSALANLAPRHCGSWRSAGICIPLAPAADVPQRGFQRLVDQLVEPQRAEQRIAAQARDQIRHRPARIPACGPPSSLSPLNETRSTPAARLSATSGSSMPKARRSTMQPLPRSSYTGMPRSRSERRQFAQLRPRGESRDAEVAGMDAQQQARAVVDGVAVVVDVRAVGGADLAQDGARARHDFGDAEAVADLDQFAARDDGFAARRKFVQREKDGGGVVVDRDAGRAEQAFEQRAGVDVALAAAPAARSYSRLE